MFLIHPSFTPFLNVVFVKVVVTTSYLQSLIQYVRTSRGENNLEYSNFPSLDACYLVRAFLQRPKTW